MKSKFFKLPDSLSSAVELLAHIQKNPQVIIAEKAFYEYVKKSTKSVKNVHDKARIEEYVQEYEQEQAGL